jgi:transposase
MVGKLTRVSNKGLTCASHSAAADLTGDAMVVRRRNERWPDAERDRITTVSLGLLHYWRRQARAIGAVEELRFVPVTVGEDAVRRTGTLELTIRDVTVRVEGDVEVARLRMVLEAIRA